MPKSKWGTKRTCPKCGTRFYDLGKDSPAACIGCKTEWVPEPLLKSRQPQAEEPKPVKKPEAPPPAAKETDEALIESEGIEIEEDEEAEPIEEVELEDDGEDVSTVVQDPKASE